MTIHSEVVLYHGTDWESALNILNVGLNAEKLRKLQSGRRTQMGAGWYATEDIDIAWYFASLAPGLTDGGYTVIEMAIDRSDLDILLQQELALQRSIANVPYSGQQYWFSPAAFVFLNERVRFRPYTGEEAGVDK